MSKKGGNYKVKFYLAEVKELELVIFIEGENGEKEERKKIYPTNEWIDLGYLEKSVFRFRWANT